MIPDVSNKRRRTPSLSADAPNVEENPSARRAHSTYAGLDLLRGIAAIFVMAEHARSFVLADFAAIPRPSLADRAIYFATGLGHEAVIVFFVLSGFFISRSVLGAAKHWSWKDYAVTRLSRLWTVLIPSLVFTFVLDHAARNLTGSTFYTGTMQTLYHSGPDPISAESNYSLATFGGNVLFLQTILVPVFGNNGPLWSLANEFWYYVLFPLAYFCIRPSVGRGRRARLFNGLVFLAIALFLPANIRILGLVWLMGFVVLLIERRGLLGRIPQWNLAFASAVGLFIAALVVSRLHVLAHVASLPDFVVAAATSLLVLALAHRDSPIFGRLGANFLSKTSYTVYLFHFPLLAFLAAVSLGNTRLSPGAGGYAVFAAFVMISLGICYCAYFCFERHTPAVRKAAHMLIGMMSRTHTAASV